MGKRQQRYLRDHVDPVLKPLIRRALGGSELPPDFKEWIWTQLCVDFGEKKSTHGPAPVETVPEAIHNQNELMKSSKPVFSALPPVDFESTRGVAERETRTRVLLHIGEVGVVVGALAVQRWK